MLNFFLTSVFHAEDHTGPWIPVDKEIFWNNYQLPDFLLVVSECDGDFKTKLCQFTKRGRVNFRID